MLQGPADHQDAQLRTSTRSRPSTTPASRSRSSPREIGDWSRPVAQEHMGAISPPTATPSSSCIANNDDMALGAIEALQGERLLR